MQTPSRSPQALAWQLSWSRALRAFRPVYTLLRPELGISGIFREDAIGHVAPYQI